jgi:hypothetical protein
MATSGNLNEVESENSEPVTSKQELALHLTLFPCLAVDTKRPRMLGY